MPTSMLDVHPKAREKILACLRRAEGHVRGSLHMVERDQDCLEVITHTRAARRSLDRINALVLERRLMHCARVVIRSEDARDREQGIIELLDIFEAARVKCARRQDAKGADSHDRGTRDTQPRPR